VTINTHIVLSSRTTVSNWENKRAKPPLKYLKKLCEKYDLNLNWLLTGEGSATKTGEASEYSRTQTSQNIINKGQIGNNCGNVRISNTGDVNKNIPPKKNIVTNYNTSPKSPTTGTQDTATKLLEIVKLLKEGLITDEEFKIVKEGLLGTG
jgi:hypothetical protein